MIQSWIMLLRRSEKFFVFLIFVFLFPFLVSGLILVFQVSQSVSKCPEMALSVFFCLEKSYNVSFCCFVLVMLVRETGFCIWIRIRFVMNL